MLSTSFVEKEARMSVLRPDKQLTAEEEKNEYLLKL